MEAGSKWMGGSSLEPPIGVAVKGVNYDVRSPGIVIQASFGSLDCDSSESPSSNSNPLTQRNHPTLL